MAESLCMVASATESHTTTESYKIANSSAVQFLPCFYLKKKKKKVDFVSAVVFHGELCVAVNIVYELYAFVFYGEPYITYFIDVGPNLLIES